MIEYDEDDVGLHHMDSNTLTKYKTSSKIANQALSLAKTRCIKDALPNIVCKEVDEFIENECSKIYKKNKYYKGVAFPCHINVNEIVCNDTNNITPLKDGDIVKIHTSVQIDGCMVEVADTIKITPDPVFTQTLMTVQSIFDKIILKEIKFENFSHSYWQILQRELDIHGLYLLEGCLSPEIHQYIPEGKAVIGPPLEFGNVEFGHNQVFVIDLTVTPKKDLNIQPIDDNHHRMTIYKRNIDINYILKSPAARTLFYDIEKRNPIYAFNLSRYSPSGTTYLGLKELLAHDLLTQYPIYKIKENKDVFIISVKKTILVTAEKTVVL
jgi:hypothetical protein